MYCGEGENNKSACDKETLQLSPHIAAHKSSPSIVNIPFVNENSSGDNQVSTRLITIPNSPVYKLNMSSIPTAHVDLPYNIRNSNMVIQTSGTFPEDLSATTVKGTIISADVANKPLPVTQPVISQAIDGLTGSIIVSDRTPTFYSFADGTTVTFTGQHPLFVSSVNGDNAGVGEIYSTRPDGNSATNSIITSSGETGTPIQDMTVLPYQPPGLNDGQLIVPEIISGPIIWDEQDMKKLIKNEEDTEQKDLVRQALQAAVSHSSPRMTTEDILVNDYGSPDCISEDGICHSTFSIQSKPQELVMMSGHLGTVQNNAKYIGSVSALLPTDIPNGAQVLVLQAAVPETTNGSTVDLSSRRKRLRDVVQPRKKNVANRMKEKRANESDDQRKRRRSREAERMRKKRLLEDESTKQRRRHEAADRARKRRANLSPSERDMERKKAAQRMRARRLKENEDERKVRRDKAAERMRLRRSKETREEKAIRRQCASSTKVKGKRKKDSDPLNIEEYDDDEYIKIENGDGINSLNIEPSPQYRASSDSPSSFIHKNKDSRIKVPADHSLLNSALSNPSANFTLVSNDVLHNDGRFIHVPMSNFPDVVPMTIRNLNAMESQRIPSMTGSPTQNITINKRTSNQAPPSYSESISPVIVNEAHTEPMQRLSGAQLGIHHLPHLLHHQHLSTYPPDHQYHSDQVTVHVKNQ